MTLVPLGSPLHLPPKTNKVSVKRPTNFLPAALSITITGGRRRSGYATLIGANHASDAMEERMTSYKKLTTAAAVLAVSFVAARSTYAQDATNIADQVT